MNKKKKIMLISLIATIIVIVIVIISLTLFIKSKNSSTIKEDNKEQKQQEVITIISNYVDKNVQKYAKTNSKERFSIKELKGIFNKDISKFNKLPYGCHEETTFIKYNEDYSDYIVLLDCQEFYLNK